MKFKDLPLEEISIRTLYYGENHSYEVPVYQRNYAWEKEEISALVQDVYDAFINDKNCYYIGTLVSYNKGEGVFEIIDGQQRLTTINLILRALGLSTNNKLTYRARQKSTNTLNSIPEFNIDEKDIGIFNGYRYAELSINEIVCKGEKDEFITYFLDNVHIIHYQVPKDVDLNHYFEIMNSRGEQLEKHEIVKAKFLGILHNREDREKFNRIWENCSNMSIYIQDKYYVNNAEDAIFGRNNDWLCKNSFEDLPLVNNTSDSTMLSINDIISANNTELYGNSSNKQKKDSFQPIIDFPNFLLIVLKITRITTEENFDAVAFNLDDKELLNEFSTTKLNIDAKWVKIFGFNLLKCKYLLDNFIVHHSNEEDTIDNNPWKLQYWQKTKKDKTGYTKNLTDDEDVQDKLVQLLSMFEVSFTARQRKNYLFYCLLYLFNEVSFNRTFIKRYCRFVEELARKYFKDVYMDQHLLNEINIPIPKAFDQVMLENGGVVTAVKNTQYNFEEIYGDGIKKSKGIPLFVFNYLDYRLWAEYLTLRGKKTTPESKERKMLFAKYGCRDFNLKVFEQFYFSRTRRSLEHYYPQANVNIGDGLPNENEINCFGNYAMIGSEINSSGSNCSPKFKLNKYLYEKSGKVKIISVASIKFVIMMQICNDNIGVRESGYEWIYEDIKKHQENMVKILK